MKPNRVWSYILLTCLAAGSAWLIGCASTTGAGEVGADRKQLMLVPTEAILDSSEKAYEQTKTEAKKKKILDRDNVQVGRLNTIMRALVPHTAIFNADAVNWNWEVHVTTSDEINAYCMPGGKIMFYSGIIEKLNLTNGEIAAIMGHEIAHALREHGRERMSQELFKQIGLELLLATGKMSPRYVGLANGIILGAISLPHGRQQESEADNIGLELMARAGHNPEEAISLWTKMSAHGGAKPPEILSTHPSDATRIANIRGLLPKVMPLYQRAQKN